MKTLLQAKKPEDVEASVATAKCNSHPHFEAAVLPEVGRHMNSSAEKAAGLGNVLF